MNEWISVEKRLPDDSIGRYIVKTKEGLIKKAFFMPDKAAWRAWYGQPISYWLETPSAELIFDVIEWAKE